MAAPVHHSPAQHDAYAPDYDRQVQEYGCYIAEMLFGLCYAETCPGQRLLDAGTGSGLSMALFHRAGLEVHGFDFSPAMLEVCRAKGFAASLKLHDILAAPWPYTDGEFDIVVCCGVFHFLPDIEPAFAEARRVLRPGGWMAFTTKSPRPGLPGGEACQQQSSGEMDIYAHFPEHIRALAGRRGFALRKFQQVFVGEELHSIWAAQWEE